MKQRILEALPLRIYLELKRWHYKRSHNIRFERSQKMRITVTENGYSYKPFDDKKAIFVHIPRCAGVSVNKTIFGNLAGGHTTLEQYLSIFEPRCINDYFKFTIVRNPWDRLVSSYFLLKNGGFDEEDRIWFERELSSFSGFDDFVRNWVNRTNIWKWYHFRPQYHYMLDKREKVSLNFVGFFENIDEDFYYIIKHIGVDCTLPAFNKSNHLHYTSHYNDETKEIVREAYKEDIRLLGYKFDNSSLQQQLTSRRTRKKYSLRS